MVDAVIFGFFRTTFHMGPLHLITVNYIKKVNHFLSMPEILILQIDVNLVFKDQLGFKDSLMAHYIFIWYSEQENT